MEVYDTSKFSFAFENPSTDGTNPEVKEEINEEVIDDEMIPKSDFDSDENITIKDEPVYERYGFFHICRYNIFHICRYQ